MLLHFKTEIDFNNMYSNCNPGGLGSQKIMELLDWTDSKGKAKKSPSQIPHNMYYVKKHILIFLKSKFLYVFFNHVYKILF